MEQTVESQQIPETKPSLPSDSQELVTLLRNEVFQQGFVDVQTQPQKEVKRQIQEQTKEKVKVLVNTEIVSEAARRLGTTVEEGMKRGKEWGETIKGIKSDVIREEEQVDGSKKSIVFWEEVNTRIKKQVEEDPRYIQDLIQAEQAIVQAEIKQKEILSKLIQEAETRSKDPELLAALEVWGRSPNSKGNFGNNNRGYNAGIIHFFEYRSDINKNGRYKYSKIPITIEGFIEYSNKLKEVISNIDPDQNPDVKASALLRDASGQIRLFILSAERDKIVGFRRENETGLPRIVTVIPGQDEKSIAQSIHDENKGNLKKRLNQLDEHVVDVPITEYPSIIQNI
jgi:hypothetical protein